MRTAMVILALTLLTACGKKGAPVPPGPSNEIVYPRQYPSR
jgi:predicted small lipoprotein YifL